MTLRSPTYLAHFPSKGFVGQSFSLSDAEAAMSGALLTGGSSSSNSFEVLVGVYETDQPIENSISFSSMQTGVWSLERVTGLLSTSISIITGSPSKAFNLSLNFVRLGATLYPLPEAGAPAEPEDIFSNIIRPGAALYPYPVVGDTVETSDLD